MISQRGWSASKEDVLAYRLLIWASEPSSSGQSLQDAGQALNADDDVLYRILQEFWDAGLAKDVDRANVPSMNSVFLTGAGSRASREISAARSNTAKRRMALRDGVVDWLDSGKNPAELADFLHDVRASFFGIPYTAEEVDAAGTYLLAKGIVTGRVNGGGDVLWPQLTSEGIDCAEGHSADVQAYLNRQHSMGGITTVTVSDSTGVNVAAGSSNVNQTLGISQEKINDIRQLVESFRQSRSLIGLDDQKNAELTELSSEILDEISRPAPDKNKLKGLLGSLQSIGVSGAGNALGSVLGQAALTLMNTL